MNQLEILIGDMTIADLAKLSGKSVAELAAYILAGEGKSASTRPPKPANGATPKASKSDASDTLARDILAALANAGTPLRSMDLEKIVGATTEIRRHVLAELLADKKIRKSGVARGTRYSLR